MLFQKSSIILVSILILAGTALADSGLPDLCLSNATMYNAPVGTISLYSDPNRTGVYLSGAQIYNEGTVVDATITLALVDFLGDPIVDFPAEDMWLESVDGGMTHCVGGTIADSDSDFYGQTTWAEPLRAGGHSMSGCQVMINGMALCQAPFNMYFNSADVNGDGVVNLADLGITSNAYFGEFNYSVDFYPDGVLNLLDVQRFSMSFGATCP